MSEREPKKSSWVEWPFKWIDRFESESTRRIVQSVISALIGAAILGTIALIWSERDWITQGSKSVWNLLNYPVTLRAWVGALVTIATSWILFLSSRAHKKTFEATKHSVKLLSDEHKKRLDELGAKPKTNADVSDSTEGVRRSVLTSIVDLINSTNRAYDALGAMIALSDSIVTENDAKWICQELVKHNYKHPFEVFEMASDNALEGKWLKILREARLAQPPVKNDMGMLSFLAMRWSEKDAWLAAKRKHDKTVQAASMAFVFADKREPSSAQMERTVTAAMAIHTAYLPIIQNFEDCTVLIEDKNMEKLKARQIQFQIYVDTFWKTFEGNKVYLSTDAETDIRVIVNTCIQYVRKGDRIQTLIDFKPRAEGQQVLNETYLDIEKIENAIVALRPKVDAHFKRLIAGQN